MASIFRDFYKGKNGLEVKVQKTEGDIDGKAYRQVDFDDLPCIVRSDLTALGLKVKN